MPDEIEDTPPLPDIVVSLEPLKDYRDTDFVIAQIGDTVFPCRGALARARHAIVLDIIPVAKIKRSRRKVYAEV